MVTWLLRLTGWLLRLGLGLALLVAVSPLLVWALAHNEWACQRMLALVPGLQITAPQGPVLGDFAAQRVTVALPRGGRLTLAEPRWKGLRLRLDAQAPWHVGVSLAHLQVRRLDVAWVADPSASPAMQVPVELALPISVEVARVQIAEAHAPWWGEQPLRALDAGLFMGGAAGQHRLQLSHLAWSTWQMRGSVTVGERAPLPVQAHLLADGQLRDSAQGSAALSAQGPLADLRVEGHARWRAVALEAKPASAGAVLDLAARVQPFAPWPLAQLSVKSKGLDLSQAWPGLPQTQITGEWTAEPEGASGLMTQLSLTNARAAAWDAKGLPIIALQARAHLPHVREARGASNAKQPPGAAPPKAINLLVQQLQGASVRLNSTLPALGNRAPGALSVQGAWGSQQPVVVTLDGIEPKALHGDAPPLRLKGKVEASPQWGSLLHGGTADGMASVTAQLQGQYFATVRAGVPAGGAKDVGLTFQGRAGAHEVVVEHLQLSAGEASAKLSKASATWLLGQPWQAQGLVDLDAFDPQVWLPWPAGVSGRNRLSGQVQGQVNGQWRGQLQATLSPGLVAGLPVQGALTWRSPLTTSRMTLDGNVDLAGNRLQAHADVPWGFDAKGQWQMRGPAQWQAQVQAPALGALQAIAPLLGARQIQGAAQGQVRGAVQWPSLQSDGNLQASGLQWVPSGAANGKASGSLSLAALSATWQIDTRNDRAPVSMDLSLKQLRRGAMVLEQTQAQLSGSVGQHRLQLSAQARNEGGKGQEPSAPVALNALIDGAFSGAMSSGTAARAWRARVRELSLRSVGKSPQTYLSTPGAELRWEQGSAAGRAESVQVLPTTVSVLGTELALQKMLWSWPDRANEALGTVDVDIRLLPLSLPKVLASWQPQAGWGGDMVVSGQVRLQHSLSKPWVVDARLSRDGGDLSLSEPTIEGSSAQKLGITQAQMALQARDGVWTLSQSFNGRLLGALSGRQVVQTRDKDRWPVGTDPLSGELDLQISSLRPWGAWMPAGWRVSGQLQGKAQLAGTLGAPEYRGEVHGQGLGLGQALMGVNLSDGELELLLQGPQATLTRLTAKGGNQGGRISAQGQASFGEAPAAVLQVQAERFALLQRVDRRVVISGQTQLNLTQDDIKADGQLRVDEGLIDISRFDAPTVGDDVNVLHRPGQVDRAEREEAEPVASQRKAQVSLDVDLGSALRLKGRGLDATLGGQLKFSTPNNKPALHGGIVVTRGTYAAYGQKLVVDRGSINFTGSIENPRLDILAMRAQSATASASDVKVGVNITGTALDPRVRLYSDPSMSETEKLSWLVLGRAPTGLGGADLGLLQSAAVALLSGEGTSPTDNLIGMLGLDELSVKQTDGTVRDTVVNVGKQVSKYWYVGYERNLTATGGNWQMIYRLAQRFTLRAQAGVDNAVDFIWSWRWD